MGVCDCRDNKLGNTQGQSQCHIESEIGAHGATESDEPVDLPSIVQRQCQGGGTLRHQRHGDILVGTFQDMLECVSGCSSYVVF